MVISAAKGVPRANRKIVAAGLNLSRGAVKLLRALESDDRERGLDALQQLTSTAKGVHSDRGQSELLAPALGRHLKNLPDSDLERIVAAASRRTCWTGDARCTPAQARALAQVVRLARQMLADRCVGPVQQAFSEQLSQTPDPEQHPSEVIATPAGDVTVSRRFMNDSLTRPSVSVSIGHLHYGESNPAHASPDEQAQKAALGAIASELGASMDPLSRLMNQQTAAAISVALMTLGNDSPLRMTDGTPLCPSGTGTLHFDIEKQTDGTFRLDVTFKQTGIEAMTKFGDDGASSLAMDSARSHYEMRFSLTASADARRLALASPVRVVDAAFAPAKSASNA